MGWRRLPAFIHPLHGGGRGGRGGTGGAEDLEVQLRVGHERGAGDEEPRSARRLHRGGGGGRQGGRGPQEVGAEGAPDDHRRGLPITAPSRVDTMPAA